MSNYTTEELIVLVKAHVPVKHWQDALIMQTEIFVKTGIDIPYSVLRPIEDAPIETDEYQNPPQSFSTSGKSINRGNRNSYGF